MGTKNNPGVFDCYAKAEPDEPMFVLLGRDRHAPTLVWLWAYLRQRHEEDQEKVAEARACAKEMLRWATEHGREVLGFEQATLGGARELVRSVNVVANQLGEHQREQMTDIEVLRMFLAETKFEADRSE